MDDIPKLQVRLVGRDGRRRYDAASRDQLVAACLQPGVSVSRLAREHGVNANLVHKWIKKAKKERSLPSAPRFVLIQIVPDLNPDGSGLSEKSVALGKRCPGSKVSALLPNGISLKVECNDESGLIAIIGAFCHVQAGR